VTQPAPLDFLDAKPRAATHGFDTLCLHAGHQPDGDTGARAVPIYQSTSFVFESPQRAADLFALTDFGNIYTRLGNPTTAVLEERIATLDGGSAGVATASGMAAQLCALLAFLKPGDHLVASNRLYGGTFTQFDVLIRRLGIETTFVDPGDPAAWKAAVRPQTRALYGETLGNPGGEVFPFEALSALAREIHVPLLIDNTFATPYLCRPLEHGADIVVYSATKFLGGHGSAIAGLVVDGGRFDWGADDRFPLMTEPSAAYHGLRFYENFRTLAFAQKVRCELLRDTGACLSPFNAFLILQGIETLSLRMERHTANARAVAEFLAAHPAVSWVRWSGLKDSPQKPAVDRYLGGRAGSVFVFALKGGREAGVKFIEGLDLFSHLANVGDSRSLVIHPASTTHQQMEEKDLKAAGIDPGQIRLSIGLESAEDLLADLAQALKGLA